MATVGAFTIIVNDNKVLLVKRTDFHMYDLPGGRKEKNESIEECAIREVMEETGYKVKFTGKVGIYNRPELNDEQHVFIAEIIGGEAIIKGDETAKLKWCGLHLLPLFMVPHRKKQIKDYKNGIRNRILTLKEPLIIKLVQRKHFAK